MTMAHDPIRGPSAGDEALCRALDRLADGALDADQRRDLFRHLERTPGGWRQCALALLEVRAWEQALRPGGRSEPPAQELWLPPQRTAAQRVPSAALRSELPVGGGSTRPVLRWCVLAASVLTAFGIGWWGRAVDSPVPAPLWPDEPLVRQQPLDGSSVPPASLVDASGGPAGSGAVPQRQRVYRVVFSDPLSGREWEQSVVAEERDDLDYAGLLSTQPAVPPWLQEELQRQGQSVQQRRRLVAYPLEDGRQLVVPVDEVQVTPVALPAY